MHCAIRSLLVTLMLGGAASAEAALVPSPLQFDFGLNAAGITSGPGTTTLTNTGNQPVAVAGIALLSQPTGVFARTGGSCSAAPFTLAAQASCTIVHTFTPSRADTFYETYRVTLSGGGFVDFGLRGEGEVGHLAISPWQLSFPQTAVGTTSAPLTLIVTNDRSVPVQISAFTSTNVPAANAFVRAGGTCPTPPFSLDSNAACTLSYTFSPAQTGESQIYVEIRTLGLSGYFPVELWGIGLPEIALFANGFEAPAGVSIR
ncbi:MAG TPA: choice-of-anchor D domain-containing protein [Tahibacter sp.]|nr:choice-of-anchor D domain-containing protein [Tahibacter sp.]